MIPKLAEADAEQPEAIGFAVVERAKEDIVDDRDNARGRPDSTPRIKVMRIA